jgi:hypothetical protein
MPINFKTREPAVKFLKELVVKETRFFKDLFSKCNTGGDGISGEDYERLREKGLNPMWFPGQGNGGEELSGLIIEVWLESVSRVQGSVPAAPYPVGGWD